MDGNEAPRGTVRPPVLTPLETDLARRDAAIPGLATVLDAEAFLAALGRAAPDRDLRGAQVDYIKYKPGTYCRAAYRVEANGAQCDLEVRACRPADLASRVAEAGEPAVPGPLGSGRIVLHDLSVLVTVFPNDPGLPQVPLLTDGARRTPLIRDLLPERPDLWEGEIRTIRYWPGRRYSAELRAGAARALVKAYTRKGFRQARRNAEVFRSFDRLRVARPLGYSETHRMIAFEWLPGRTMADLCTGPEIDRDAIVAAGAALAALHAQPPDSLECWTRQDEAAYLGSLAAELGFICPHLAGPAEGIARRLAEWLETAPVVHLAVHSDFSDTQVLINGSDAAIVDLDSARCGDPADDLGGLLAQMECYALRGKMARERVALIADALLNGYQHSQHGTPVNRIAPYTAAGLLRRARFAFRARKPDWPSVTEQTLQRADLLLKRRT